MGCRGSPHPQTAVNIWSMIGAEPANAPLISGEAQGLWVTEM